MARGALGALAEVARAFSTPPVPPHPAPPGPLIAPVDGDQPDAFVFLSLALSCAIPLGILLRALEKGGTSFDYDRFPMWLLAAYACALASSAIMFAQGPDASALTSTHWALSAGMYACALKHAHRVGDTPKTFSSAYLLALMVAFSVIYTFKNALRPRKCTSTIVVLVVFCAMPAYRIHRKQKEEEDDAVAGIRRRGGFVSLLVICAIAMQPWMGVCGSPAPWAEGTQMILDMAVLTLVTDSLWSKGGGI